MTIIPAVIAWAFTITFLVALVLVLLDVSGIRRIPDLQHRAWLFRTLFGSVIIAVVGFGTWQFDSLKQGLEGPADTAKADAKDVPTTPAPSPISDSEARGPAGRSDVSALSASPDELQPTTPDAVESREEESSAALREWAENELGARPALAAVTRMAYPACVQRLTTNPTDAVLASDAAECRRELERFHYDHIVPVYTRKAPYERNLELQEEAMRPNHLHPDILPRYSLVVNEMARLTGEVWDRFVALDRRVQDDIRQCRRFLCRRQA